MALDEGFTEAVVEAFKGTCHGLYYCMTSTRGIVDIRTQYHDIFFFMQFIENDVDGTFLLLSNDDIRTMVKAIGAQLKLIRKQDLIKETTIFSQSDDSKKPSNKDETVSHL